jgi:hypothetical protein
MTELNRRMLFGVAGATLAVAACKPTGEKGQKALTEPFAKCDDYGESPIKGGGKPPQNELWQPKHYCLVYINMDGGALDVKTAYYPTIFSSKPAGSDWTDRDTPSNNQVAAIAGLLAMKTTKRWPVTPLQGDSDFKNFNFGSQHEIYVLVDGTLASIDPEKKIVFTKNKTKVNSPEPKPNKTFYNAQVLENSVAGKDILFYQNWFLDEKGVGKKDSNPPKPKKHDNPAEEYYAMNIHILLGVAKIPGVIDPDTGNGMGNTP